MEFRKLRIAWSVAWGLVAVLLCVLWVRSYWWRDSGLIDISPSTYIHISSKFGKLIISDGQVAASAPSRRWLYTSLKFRENEPVEKDIQGMPLHRGIGFKRVRWKDGSGVILPHGFFVLATLAAAGAPWIPGNYSFSLRTLFIATTLVAIALGLIVWAAK
jgi:hypothetical protein